jgi:signal transduction histidine kinase
MNSDSDDVYLGKWLFPGSILSFIVLCAVGKNLKKRFMGLGERRPTQITYTFYAYGVLQFIYPLTPLMRDERILSIPFVFAQILKVINAVLMMGVLQSARDQEIEKVNRELANKEKKLERQARFADLGVLAASIKHDINTPLATMGSHVNAIKNRFSGNDDILKTMEKLEQSMSRISGIASIVDLIPRDSSLMDQESIMVRAGLLVIAKDAVKSVKTEKIPIIGKTVIRIKGRETYVRAFVPLLEQVLVNIIKNGLEAIFETKQERGLINIQVTTIKIPDTKYSRWASVEIVDNGGGMPEEHIQKLGSGFTTRPAKTSRSGVGLYTGKRIVSLHQGKLIVESKLGEGTTVTILLPEWSALQKATIQAESRVRLEADDDPSVPPDLAAELVDETTYSELTENDPDTKGGTL